MCVECAVEPSVSIDRPSTFITVPRTPNLSMIRHFTSTGIVAIRGASLVHWHEKVQAWLAPGGHIESNEDPVQATLREVKEETGLDVRVIPTAALPYISNLEQITPPYTVMVEDVFDQEFGAHQHIDFIYFTTPVDFSARNGALPEVPEGWHWLTKEELVNATPLETPYGELAPPPEDVLKLSIVALELLEKGTPGIRSPAPEHGYDGLDRPY